MRKILLDWRNLDRSCDACSNSGFSRIVPDFRIYQTLCWVLTKLNLALVIRAVQLVLQESIGAIGVRHDAARQASPASGLLRPLLGAAFFLSALPSPPASH